MPRQKEIPGEFTCESNYVGHGGFALFCHHLCLEPRDGVGRWLLDLERGAALLFHGDPALGTRHLAGQFAWTLAGDGRTTPGLAVVEHGRLWYFLCTALFCSGLPTRLVSGQQLADHDYRRCTAYTLVCQAQPRQSTAADSAAPSQHCHLPADHWRCIDHPI